MSTLMMHERIAVPPPDVASLPDLDEHVSTITYAARNIRTLTLSAHAAFEEVENWAKARSPAAAHIAEFDMLRDLLNMIEDRALAIRKAGDQMYERMS